MSYSTGRLILLTLIAFMASACSSVTNLVSPDAETLDRLPGNHGVVVLRVTDLAGGIPFDRITFESVKSDGSARGSTRRIDARSISDRGSSEYVAVIKAGEYSLSELFGKAGIADPGLVRRVESTGDLGTFTVTDGRLTNLGTVFYYPAPSGDRYRDLLVRSKRFPGVENLLATHYAKLERSLETLDPPLTWNQTLPVSDSGPHYSNLALNPVALDQALTFDDEVIILSRLGGMLRGGAGREWRADAVVSDTAVVFVDKNQHGDIIAVTEDGSLFLQSAGQRAWLQVAGPEAAGKLLTATINDERSLQVFVQSQYTLTVFDAPAVAAPDWTARIAYRPDLGWQSLPDGELLSTPTRERWKPGQMRRTKIPEYGPLKHVSFTRAGGQLALTVRSRLYAFDKKSVEISEVNTGFDVRRLSSNGRLLITGDLALAGAAVGRRWSSELHGRWRMQTLTFNMCPPDMSPMPHRYFCISRFNHVRHASNPYLAVDGTQYSIILPNRQEDNTPFFALLRPEAKTWERIVTEEAFPQYCNRVFPSGQDDVLIIGCSGASGKLYEYDIAEGTYTLVHEPTAFWEHAEAPVGGGN